jgi:hypothetical protein
MTERIDSRFATANETADVLGVRPRRVKELARLVKASMKARKASGISWRAPASTRKALRADASEVFNILAKVAYSREKPSTKSKGSRRKQRRGKKSKTVR